MATTTTNPVFERIRQEIGQNDVVLYMKGSPVFPQCGFSAAVVHILSELGVTAASYEEAEAAVGLSELLLRAEGAEQKRIDDEAGRIRAEFDVQRS